MSFGVRSGASCQHIPFRVDRGLHTRTHTIVVTTGQQRRKGRGRPRTRHKPTQQSKTSHLNSHTNDPGRWSLRLRRDGGGTVHYTEDDDKEHLYFFINHTLDRGRALVAARDFYPGDNLLPYLGRDLGDHRDDATTAAAAGIERDLYDKNAGALYVMRVGNRVVDGRVGGVGAQFINGGNGARANATMINGSNIIRAKNGTGNKEIKRGDEIVMHGWLTGGRTGKQMRAYDGHEQHGQHEWHDARPT